MGKMSNKIDIIDFLKNTINITTYKLYFMATQQITIQETNNAVVFNKPAVNKLVCTFVAGLLFTAMLYNRAAYNSQPTCTPVNKTVSQGTGNAAGAKGSQSREASPTFSLMPGGLSRFLQ